MVIRDFLRWIGTAPSAARADATNALARAWLHSGLNPIDRDAAEAAMTFLLDDPAPLVRAALADALGASDRAPRHIVLALANDLPAIASLVLMRSPLFLDSELVDFAAAGDVEIQVAIALRPHVSAAVSGALAEVGAVDACVELLANPGASISRGSFERIIDRFKEDSRLRCAMMQRPGVPLAVKQKLVADLSETLATMPFVRSGIRSGKVENVVGEARDKVTVALAGEAEDHEIPGLVEYLRQTAQLTPTLLLRTVCSGNVMLFACALASLTGMPRTRVSTLLNSAQATSLRALFAKAELPRSTHAAFVAAVETYRDMRMRGERLHGHDFTRRMIREVLARYEGAAGQGLDQLRGLLHRLEGEAAREAARHFVHGALTAA